MNAIHEWYDTIGNFLEIDSDLLIKLSVALLASFIFGMDREIKMKGIGVKTTMIIFVAAAILTHIALEISYDHAARQLRVVDPTRIPSYLLSSIGFLGAGLILHKQNNVIAGLTTAAMVWSSVVLGIMIGFGYSREALLIVIVLVILINCLPKCVRFFGPKTMRMEKIRMTIKYKGDSKQLIQHLKNNDIVLGKVRIKDSDKEQDLHSLAVTAMIKDNTYITDIYDVVRQNDSVVALDVEGI